ncbi:MAG TPA: ferritin-like domain-containing protein [Thermoleophilaceae bacterium]|nr:ferritin-like domain-containing protein [Thermoleophilaceae bacterium]
MPASITRRGAMGAGAAALALGSCGGGDPPPAGGARPGSGAALLGSLLALELAVIAAYGASAQVMSGPALAAARVIREQEREHARILERLIRDLGGDPPSGRSDAEYARTFPRLESQRDALRFLEDLEQRQVRAYLEALAELPELELRRQAAEIGAAEGEQLAAVRVLDGRPASPHAFETGAL